MHLKRKNTVQEKDLSGVLGPKDLPGLLHLQEMQENLFQSLGREDPLEEEITTHSSILAWKTPLTEEPDGL